MQGRSCFFSLAWMLLFALFLVEAEAAVVEELLNRYQEQGAGPFNAQRGERLYRQPGTGDEGSRCAECHAEDPRKVGKHVRTGKEIAPLSPQVNPERLQDAAKVEKWFLRNCKGSLGRECTPQEKGDFLRYLTTAR
ncbi:DUF1924 domain-containing protein [Candidatus Magnetaquicoccus inordinatus]|uniref:DUF1924 domain-containing protein n=1 Tax=Candidatus Magnetaquicoccus inordinatus TaxID=2496818 RepID=UPI001D0F00D7|nr:DUF1924 domain-containing protein [Candidatus Magnetaquicoccus inordinatus]